MLFARCEHASKVESDEWDGPVASDRWWAARLHRVSCRPCRREAKLMRWLRKMLAQAPDEVRAEALAKAEAARLSPEAAERIQAALAAARDSERG